MKEHRLFDAITDLPDGVVAEAEIKKPRRFRRWYIPAVAAALALCFFLGSVLWPDGATIGMVANAAYLAEYPDGKDSALPYYGDLSGVEDFTRAVVVEFFGDNTDSNRVCSPINIYMALSMLAEVTDTNSRKQILDALGESDIATLRENANTLWNNVYRDDGYSATLLANSLWLRNDTEYVKDTFKTLAENYYASSFVGEMGSSQMNGALRDWMNQNTKNMLSDQIAQLKLDPLTVMTMVSTVYYKGRWASAFNSNYNTRELFHTVNGDKEVTFMNKNSEASYYWSEKFAATVKSLGASNMWLVLPDEGVSPEELLLDDAFWYLVQGGSYMDMMNGDAPVSTKSLIVDLSVPKFDISDQLDLTEGLKNLGITDVFEMGVGDFSPLTTDWSDIFVSQALHGARLKIDEEGCEGVAYTVIGTNGGSVPPDDRVELKFDRPFVFVLTNRDNIPIFFGIVHNP